MCVCGVCVCAGSTDVAVPFSRLADIIEVSKKEMDDLGLFASILGHIGEFVSRSSYLSLFPHPFPALLLHSLHRPKALPPPPTQNGQTKDFHSGNFHESIIYNPINGEREKVEECVKNMVKRALDMEGTCTGEHSIGWGKKDSLLLEVGPDTLAVMMAIKGALDPYWIM